MCCLIFGSSTFAEVDRFGSIQTELSGGTDQETVLSVTPSLGIEYSRKNTTGSHSLSTEFNSAENDYRPDTWQSSNRWNWQNNSGRLNSALIYDHTETDLDANRKKSDLAAINLGYSIPQTSTLSHQITLSNQYLTLDFEGDESLRSDEWNTTAGYTLNRQSSKNSRWSAGVSRRFSDAGSQVTTGNLGWGYADPRLSLSANGYANESTFDDNVNTNLGWDASVQFKRETYAVTVKAEQTQSDAISFLQFTDLDITLDQQTLVLVNQVSASVDGLQLSKTATLSLSYLIGTSESVFSIEELGVDDVLSVDFQQMDAAIDWQLSDKNGFTGTVKDRQENDRHSRTGTLRYARPLSSSLNFGASIEKDLLADNDSFSWALSLNYGF